MNTSPEARGARVALGAFSRAALVALLAIPLTACASHSPSAPARIGVVTGETPNRDTIALPGDSEKLISRAIDRLPSAAERALKRSGVPGMAIAVVHGDRTVFSAGYGVRTAGESAAVTPETVFPVASVSKPLSATGVAAAIGESVAAGGELGWETPIRDLLPGFALSDETVTGLATVGDAFSHRTGLGTGAGDDLEDLGFDQSTILDRLRLQPLDDFRSSYHYSNFGLTIGAEAVAASRHESWQELMHELVFAPLSMASTSTTHADFLARDNRVSLHALENGDFVPKYDRDADPEAPAGGVSSTVLDLAKWMRLLLAGGSIEGEPIVDEAPLAEAMSAQIVSGTGPGIEGRPSHYGYGFNVSPQAGGRMAISHSGAFVLGAATAFQVVPSLDLGIVVLTNGAPVGLPEAVAAQFLDEVQYGRATRDWVRDAARFFAGYTAPSGDLVGEERPASPAPAPAAATLVGRYENPYFGELRVVETPQGLEARLGMDLGTRLALGPWSGSTFSYAPSSESAPWGSLASASFGPDGRTLRLASFDEQGLGTWNRLG